MSPTFTLEYQDWKEIAIELLIVYNRIKMVQEEKRSSEKGQK